MNHHAQMLAIKALCDAIVAAVDAAGPSGAPGGVLYSALMSQGCTLAQFESIAGGMVGAGLLCKVGQCYFLGELGLEMMGKGSARFKVGDVVTFTNENGVAFPGKTIVDVERITRGSWQGWGYRYAPSDSPWFAVRENQLTLEGGRIA